MSPSCCSASCSFPSLVRRVQHPVLTLAVLPSHGRQYHEAIMHGEVAVDGVAPAPVLLIAVVRKVFMHGEVAADGVAPAPVLLIAVVRKVLHDIVVNAVQRLPLLGCVLNQHQDECGVRVGRLDCLHLLVTQALLGWMDNAGTGSGIALDFMGVFSSARQISAVRVQRRSGGGAVLRSAVVPTSRISSSSLKATGFT